MLPSDQKVLRFLLMAGRPVRSEEVGEHMGYSFPQSVEARRPNLKRLAADGLATRTDRIENKTHRAYYEITEKGRARAVGIKVIEAEG